MTVPFANSGGAVLPDDAGQSIDRDPIDDQIRQAAVECDAEISRDTWQPRYEAEGEDGDAARDSNDLDSQIRQAAAEVKQRDGFEEVARGARVRPDAFAGALAQRNAEAAADWWLENDPVGANACAAELHGTGKCFGIDPAVHGPALVQSFTRAQEYAELGKQVDAFRIQHKLTDSAVRRMTEAINSGACERSLQAAYDHVMSRSTNPREREEWFRHRNPHPAHLFSPNTEKSAPRVARESNPWSFSDRPAKGF
jgi:hypothetical protein